MGKGRKLCILLDVDPLGLLPPSLHALASLSEAIGRDHAPFVEKQVTYLVRIVVQLEHAIRTRRLVEGGNSRLRELGGPCADQAHTGTF